MCKKCMPRYKGHPLNQYALPHAILFFIFALILWGFDGCIFLVWFYRILGTIAIAASVIFIAAVFYEPWEKKLKYFLEKKYKYRWKGCFQALFWGLYTIVFTTAFLSRWLGAMSDIGKEWSIIHTIAFGFGLILFVIIFFILLIPFIIWFKNILHFKLRRAHKSNIS